MSFNHGSSRLLRPALLAAVLALPMAFSLIACSDAGPKKVAADKWVESACNLAADYKKVTDAQGEKLNAIDPDKDPPGAKKDLVAAFDAVAKARGDFRSGFDKLGEPDLKSGADVVKAFQAHDDASKKALSDARGKLGKLDTGAKTFTDDMTKILTDIPDPDFRAELQKVVDKQSDAQQIVDGIDAKSDCADVFFSGSSSSASAATATPSAKTTPKSSPIARTTVKPNATRNERWIVGLCVAAQSYVDDVESLSADIDFSKVASDPQKLKDLMVSFLQNARDRSQQFKRDIDKLQAPDVKDGAKIQSAMSNAAGQVVTLFDKAVNDAKALDAKNPQKLADGLTQLGDSLSTASDDVSGAFNDIDTKYDTTELTKVANTVPECGSFFK